MAAINTAIREHETSLPWQKRELSIVCFQAIDLLQEFFGDSLPDPVFNFDRANCKQQSHSRLEINGIGVEGEIGLNIQHLDRPLYKELV